MLNSQPYSSCREIYFLNPVRARWSMMTRLVVMRMSAEVENTLMAMETDYECQCRARNRDHERLTEIDSASTNVSSRILDMLS